MFKELFTESINGKMNEGTQASIIVKTGEGKYSMSYAQYDGYLQGIGKELVDNFYSDKDAKKLVQKSGEIRGIDNGKVEYYTDRTLLIKNAKESKVCREANAFSTYKYYWDGLDWYYTQSKCNGVEDIGFILQDQV